MKQEDYLEIIEQNKGKHRPSLETLVEGRKFGFIKDKSEHNYSGDYFTFVALKNNTRFTFTPKNNNIISYSVDNGKTWIEGNSVEVNTGNKVLWKGEMIPAKTYPTWGIGTFNSTEQFDVQGNIMSLLFSDNFEGQVDLTGKPCAFHQLFYNCVTIINSENLILPATTLSKFCYEEMFRGCRHLISTPELPAIVLTESCYYYMFQNCADLTKAPELPATTLATSCYSGMFDSCTSLVIAPELPAATLANSCYNHMFNDCALLVVAPELPATILVTGCYGGMFYGCASLTKAPVLPATTLVNQCYNGMFYNCTSLNYIKAMFTTTPTSDYTFNWVYNVAPTGTFVKNSTASWNVSGDNGVPNEWTIETATE